MAVIAYNDIETHIGEETVTDWSMVDQRRINQFAEATGDHQWIHVDVDRATRQLGSTIAHGFLTLSLLGPLSEVGFAIVGASRGLNYGLDKVRFISPVRSGARIRLRQRLENVTPKDGGKLLARRCTVEIEGAERAALVADWLTLYYP